MKQNIILIFAVIGAVATCLVTSALLYYMYSGELRPNMQFRNAIGEVKYTYALPVFIIPAILTGTVELGWNGFIFGLAVGLSMILYLIILQWLFGPV